MERRDREGRPMVTGMFRDRDSAERAYRSLTDRGYAKDDVHLLMSEDTRKRHFADASKKDDGLGSKALEGTGVGAAVGGAAGATILGILAAGTAVTVPGIGLLIAGTAVTVPGIGLLIAGPLAGALAGAGVGAATGGIVGALVGAGIPEDRAREYERGIKEGHIVMGVSPRTNEDAEYFEREWSTTGSDIRR